MDKIIIYTDGACQGNPGPGGWAWMMQWKDNYKENAGCEKHTTNNRMELTAVIEALKAIKRQVDEIELYSDSQYVVKGINEWLKSWKQRNFANVKNSDLWKELDFLIDDKSKKFTANWVRAHNGHPENEKADKMAVSAIRSCR